MSPQYVDIQLANGENNDLDFEDRLGCLSEGKIHAERVLNRFAQPIVSFEMRFASSKGKALLLNDFNSSKQLLIVDHFT